MDEPPIDTASCEAVDIGFGVFIAKTPPPRKPLPETRIPIASLEKSLPITRLSPYVSIVSTKNAGLISSTSPTVSENETLLNVRSVAASSL